MAHIEMRWEGDRLDITARPGAHDIAALPILAADVIQWLRANVAPLKDARMCDDPMPDASTAYDDALRALRAIVNGLAKDEVKIAAAAGINSLLSFRHAADHSIGQGSYAARAER